MVVWTIYVKRVLWSAKNAEHYYTKRGKITTVNTNMGNNISVTQALQLEDYFVGEQKDGRYKSYDFTDIVWTEITEGQRKRIWYLIYNEESESDLLTDMLFSLGLKLK